MPYGEEIQILPEDKVFMRDFFAFCEEVCDNKYQRENRTSIVDSDQGACKKQKWVSTILARKAIKMPQPQAQ